MKHVYSLAVWQDRLYWTDWDKELKQAIYSCRKRDGHERKIDYKDDAHKVFNMMVFHPSMYKPEV